MSDLAFTVVGVGALLAALLPRLLEGRRPVSLPIVFLLLGAVLGLAPGLPRLDPLRESGFVEHLTEVTVIIALMGRASVWTVRLAGAAGLRPGGCWV